jgi:sulfhydrogenase subunit beta (sulfur reductase)
MSTKTSAPPLIISKENLIAGINKALADFNIAALTRKGEQALYDYIKNGNEIEFEYTPTVLSPKKFFFPQDETILEYTSDGKVATKIAAKASVLFGIRPCDLNGFKILNEAFADDNGDPNYLAKLEKAVVIGMDCKKLCDKDAFCFKVAAHNAKGGFDIMLSAYDTNNFLLEIANEKGTNFVSKYFVTSSTTGDEKVTFQKAKDAVFGNQKPFKNLNDFPEIFEKNKHHPVWDQEGSRCLSCGSCIMVCPTCYCFDVVDELNLDLKKGQRIRKWDACMLSAFASVASGENFRHNATIRLHHRINRKFHYLMKKHGQSVCVGCGRCVRACLADISPKTIAETITGDNEGGK